jgi:hypothetical protein
VPVVDTLVDSIVNATSSLKTLLAEIRGIASLPSDHRSRRQLRNIPVMLRDGATRRLDPIHFIHTFVKRLTLRAKLPGFCRPQFLSSNTGSFVLATVGEIIVFGFGYGTILAFYTESFQTLSGLGCERSYQISKCPDSLGLILSATEFSGPISISAYWS